MSQKCQDTMKAHNVHGNQSALYSTSTSFMLLFIGSKDVDISLCSVLPILQKPGLDILSSVVL